jgi:two-component system phosphate regulon response regulator PhoB
MARTVVLVEDHAPVRELYAVALRGAGWRVVERPTAERLLGALQRSRAAAVVLDWTLPGKSGLDALRAIKSDRRTRHVRVLVLTAHAASSLRAAALAAGAEQFLHKPLRPDALIAALDGADARALASHARVL